MKKNQPTKGISANQIANAKGYINEKKLFDMLYPDSKKRLSDSLLSPSAQCNTPCSSLINQEPAEIAFMNNINRIKVKDLKLFYIAYLQFIGGLRISEVLSITVYDISLSGHISIKSLKNSANSVIHGGESSDYLIRCKINGVNPFEMYSRFYVYRQYQKYGIGFQSKNSSKASVTHAMRHVSSASLKKANIDKEQIQKFLRHKNPKNTERYGNN